MSLLLRPSAMVPSSPSHFASPVVRFDCFWSILALISMLGRRAGRQLRTWSYHTVVTSYHYLLMLVLVQLRVGGRRPANIIGMLATLRWRRSPLEKAVGHGALDCLQLLLRKSTQFINNADELAEMIWEPEIGSTLSHDG